MQPVAPSAILIEGGGTHTRESPKSYETQRALRDDEIPRSNEGFRRVAENARCAGFDGVELHGANGYLLDQFLRDVSNRRGGPYGGSVENHRRLMLEVADAVTSVFGLGRVGLRPSPLNVFNSMRDSDPVGLTNSPCHALSPRGLSYLHVMRADFLGQQHVNVLGLARRAFHELLVANMGYSPDGAALAVESGSVDAVAFGTEFLANPDLPARIQAKAPLNTPDPLTF